MIFHNRYLAITDIKEMGQYTFDNLKGFEDFSKKAEPGDIIITGKNFGCGSSRQQAVDCFALLEFRQLLQNHLALSMKGMPLMLHFRLSPARILPDLI